MSAKKEKTVSEAVALSCSTIQDLDNGVFGLMVDKQIALAANDLDDRGEEDGKPRRVVIDLEIVKVRGMVIITPRVDVKLPPRVSNSTAAKERMAGKGQTELLFQANNYENPDQGVLVDGEVPNDD